MSDEILTVMREREVRGALRERELLAENANLLAKLHTAHAELAARNAELRAALDENDRLRAEFQSLYAAAATLLQNAGPMFVALKQAADRAYMAAAERRS